MRTARCGAGDARTLFSASLSLRGLTWPHHQGVEQRLGALGIERVIADLAVGSDHALGMAVRRSTEIADEAHAFARPTADVAGREGLAIEVDGVVADPLRRPPGDLAHAAEHVHGGDRFD